MGKTSSSYRYHANELEGASKFSNEHKQHSTYPHSTDASPDTPFYLSSHINEGIGHVEEITEYPGSDKNTDDVFAEDEIYIATKVPNNLLGVTNDGDLTLPHHCNKHDYGEQLSDISEYQSDSDEIFRLSFESSSDDDEFTNSNKIVDKTPLNRGNLPFLERLDANSTCNTRTIKTQCPLRFQSIPTATVVRESTVSDSCHFLTSYRRSFSVEDDRKSQSCISKQKSPIEPYEEAEGVAQYCSTKVQTKLLNKISNHDADALDNTITHSRFPEEDFSMLPPKKSKSAFKIKSFSKLNEEPKTVGNSFRKTFEKDLDLDLENFETEVNKAFKDSVTEGSFMPLLKQELQCTIQVRRLSKGQPELILEPEEAKTYELTPEELKKKEARLEQNRRSARKSRSKAKSHERKLIKTIKKEMTENARLSKELVNLRTERDKYRKMHDDHTKSCTRLYTH